MRATAPSPSPTEPATLAGELGDEERRYLSVHGRRLEYALELVRELAGGNGARILDVGPHFLTELLRRRTGAVVDQLGFRYDRVSRPRPGERHFELDLNELGDRGRWPSIPPHELVLACEVIEHLHVPPSAVLAFLRTCLAPRGHLVVQTPNGVALKRRAVMLLGRNPFELIRDTPHNPGHFREYTREEIVRYARAEGFELLRFGSRSYFDYRSLPGLGPRLYGAVTELLPSSLRDGMTFVLRRTD